MKILTALAIAALIIAFSANGVKADAPNPNCLPTSLDDPTCRWQLELAKVADRLSSNNRLGSLRAR